MIVNNTVNNYCHVIQHAVLNVMLASSMQLRKPKILAALLQVKRLLQNKKVQQQLQPQCQTSREEKEKPRGRS